MDMQLEMHSQEQFWYPRGASAPTNFFLACKQKSDMRLIKILKSRDWISFKHRCYSLILNQVKIDSMPKTDWLSNASTKAIQINLLFGIQS